MVALTNVRVMLRVKHTHSLHTVGLLLASQLTIVSLDMMNVCVVDNSFLHMLG